MSAILSSDIKNKIIEIRSPHIDLDELYMFDTIPRKLLENATKKYASAIGPDEVVVFLYDDTLFKSANEGFILTSKRLYYKNISEKGGFVALSDIDDVTFKEGRMNSNNIFVRTPWSSVEVKLQITNPPRKAKILFDILNITIELLKNPDGIPMEKDTSRQGDNVNVIDSHLKKEILASIQPIGKLYLFEDIPPRKLKNAMKSYAPDIDKNETLILLYDDTFFGGAGAGVIITEKRLYSKNRGEIGKCARVSDIVGTTAKFGLYSTFFIELSAGDDIAIITTNSRCYAEALFDVLDRIINILKNKDSTHKAE